MHTHGVRKLWHTCTCACMYTHMHTNWTSRDCFTRPIGGKPTTVCRVRTHPTHFGNLTLRFCNCKMGFVFFCWVTVTISNTIHTWADQVSGAYWLLKMAGASFTEHIVPLIVEHWKSFAQECWNSWLLSFHVWIIHSAARVPCSCSSCWFFPTSLLLKKIKIQKANRNSFYYNLLNKYLCVSAIG